MKKITKPIVFAILIVCIIALCGCGKKYDDIAGEYVVMSIDTEFEGLNYKNVAYSVLKLTAKGQYTFKFCLKDNEKLQVAGGETPDGADDIFIEGAYEESGKFSATESQLTIESGMLQGSHQIKTKRIEISFIIKNINVKGLYVFS